ncbi:MAG TPA: BadF/BadG/BcrA/BcrD ATPase family protein [Candidatus Binatia bacterium]|nr:BadF/BadG/BcrA/BcrD ATPase family protein [Candidatus Binatia bacterium]
MIAAGVDAGASQIIAVVSRDAGIVGTAHGGSANPTNVGIDDAADAILRTLRKALGGVQPDAIYVGAAGAGREDVAQTLRFLIASAFPRAVVGVGDDASIALRSAIPQGPGIALIAGTGSIALADDGTRTYRIGGLGYLLGDEGSAYWIGLAALRQLGRVYDGRESGDDLTDLVARELCVDSRATLLDYVYDQKPAIARIAALAPEIVALAGRGNGAATAIVQAAAGELAELVKAAARVAGLSDKSPAVALSGGLTYENSLLTFLLEARIAADLPGATIVRGTAEAHLGALRIAESLAQEQLR